MNKFKDFLIGAMYVLLYGLIIYGEIFGIAHSAKKHNTGDITLSILVPPWAWWRSVEMWWHNDFANVDWSKRLNNDIQTCVYFLNQGIDSAANKFQLNKDLEEFSNKIKSYPDEKLTFLKDGTRNFIDYSVAIAEDIKSSFKKFALTGEFIWQQSDNSLYLEEKLDDYYLTNDIEYFKKAMNDYVNHFKESIEESYLMNNEAINNALSTMDLTLEAQKNGYRQVYKNLFNEEL